mmetsp:Transcript_77207/g.250066  ORF Transcript_77207/g.250066 Transcript_77207/m.250066 type:complete len:90 (+) Transcript_77207:319-588(+)
MEDCEDLVGELIFFGMLPYLKAPLKKENQWKIELLWFRILRRASVRTDQGFGRGENTLQPNSGACWKIWTRNLAPQTSVACWKNANGSE